MSWLARQLGKDGSSQLGIDPYFSAARISARPLDLTNGGSYRIAMRSGTLAATLAANGLLFGFRWASSTHLAIIHRVRAQLWANLAFTAAFNDMSLQMFQTRSFTVSDTGGSGNTTATVSGNNLKKRTSYATTQFATAGSIQMAGTAVISGGTGTDDAHACAFSWVGKPNNVNVAAGTEFLDSQGLCLLDYEPDMASGVSPLIFAQNEGFRLRNGPIVWPAAGTGILTCMVDWSEVENARFPG